MPRNYINFTPPAPAQSEGFFTRINRLLDTPFISGEEFNRRYGFPSDLPSAADLVTPRNLITLASLTYPPALAGLGAVQIAGGIESGSPKDIAFGALDFLPYGISKTLRARKGLALPSEKQLPLPFEEPLPPPKPLPPPTKPLPIEEQLPLPFEESLPLPFGPEKITIKRPPKSKIIIPGEVQTKGKIIFPDEPKPSKIILPNEPKPTRLYIPFEKPIPTFKGEPRQQELFDIQGSLFPKTIEPEPRPILAPSRPTVPQPRPEPVRPPIEPLKPAQAPSGPTLEPPSTKREVYLIGRGVFEKKDGKFVPVKYRNIPAEILQIEEETIPATLGDYIKQFQKEGLKIKEGKFEPISKKAVKITYRSDEPTLPKIESPAPAPIPKFQRPEDAIIQWAAERRAAGLEGARIRKAFEKYRSNSILDPVPPDVRKYFDDLFSQAQEFFDLQYRKDYLPQIWKNTQEEIDKVFGTKIRSVPGFTLQRVIKDYATGIEQGLTPRFNNLADLMGWAEQNVKKAIADKKLFNYLKTNGLIKTWGAAPKDWKVLNPDKFPLIVKGEKGTAWYAPEPIARILNTALGAEKGVLSKAADVSRFLKNIVLAGGIPYTGINWHGIVNMPARAFISRGINPIKGIGEVVRQYSYAAWPRAAEKYLEKNIDDVIEFTKKGLITGAEDFHALVSEKPSGITAIERALSEATFAKIIPATKVRYTKELVNKFVAQGMNRDEAIRAAVDLANNFFGGLDKTLRSQEVRDLMQILLLAPDWFATKVRLGKNTLKALKNPRNPVSKVYINSAAAALAGYALTKHIRDSMGVDTPSVSRAGNVPAPIFDVPGKQAEFDPFGAAFEHIEFPLRILEEISRGEVPIDTIIRTARNNASVPVGKAWNLIVGEDLFGNPLRGKNVGANIISEIADATTPQPVQGLVNTLVGRITPLEGAVQGLELPIRYYRRRRYIPRP